MPACAILLVHENDIISDLGYQVHLAYESPTGRHPYRLTVLDDKMPGMDGVQPYGHFKQVQADAVGVLVTAFAADDTIQEANQAGIRRVLPKPVDFGHLIPLIEEVAGTL